MKKGFLLIDEAKNTVILPWNDEELAVMLKRRGMIGMLESIHQHNTIKDLHTDISKYIKGTYEQNEGL